MALSYLDSVHGYKSLLKTMTAIKMVKAMRINESEDIYNYS